MQKSIASYTHKVRMLLLCINKEQMFMTGHLFKSTEEFDAWCEEDGKGFKETVQQVRSENGEQGAELETALDTLNAVGYKNPDELEEWKERFVDRLDRTAKSPEDPFIHNDDITAIVGAVITFQLENGMVGAGFIAGLPSDCFAEDGENLGPVYGPVDSHEGTLNALGVPGLEQ